MHLSHQIAKHVYEVHFGGNWTVTCVKDVLSNITYEQAVFNRTGFNSIAKLTYHINYYISEVLKVLEGQELQASDKESFQLPTPFTDHNWDLLKAKTLTDAEQFSTLVKELPEDIWDTHFTNEKYGSYFRNMIGIVEHTHYHLGQIVILKKLMKQD